MRGRLKAVAAEKKRSMNAEIVARIEEHDGLTEAYKSLRSEIDERDRTIIVLEKQVEQAHEQRDSAFASVHSEMEKFALLTHRRIPEGLYGRIARAATRSERPVEEEVLQALEKAFPPPRPTSELRQIADMVQAFLDSRSAPRTAEHDELQKLANQLRLDADEQDKAE